MDATIYAAVAVIISIVLVFVTLLRRNSSKASDNGNEERRPRAVPINRREAPAVRRRGGRQRMRAADDDSEGEGEDLFDNIAQPEGKIGAKKLRKLEEKAAKKADREAVEQEREDKKKQDALREERRKKEDEKQMVEDEKLAAEEKKRKDEEERKEHEEYLKMKEMFSVEEEGQAEVLSEDQQQGLLQEFIQYIKQMKVIMLEDLAAHFSLKTQDAIDRVNQLIEMGDLTGVLDDRGKFIYITNEEYAAVAKFIRQRGRVSITELAESSNKLINMNPDNKEVYEKRVMKEAVAV